MGPMANAHLENAASCNGSHSCPKRVVPLSSGNIPFQLIDRPTAMEKGLAVAELGLDPRGEYVSSPEITPEALPFPVMQEPRCMRPYVQYPGQEGGQQCSNMDELWASVDSYVMVSFGKMKRNIAEMRKKFDVARSRSDLPSPLPADDLTPASGRRGSKSSHERSKRQKKKRSPNPPI
ncbi:hypothetical protein Nepgr_003897 [Nepenthes gracilis]|uniref:Uncharacterized protein n=1 Tax=Nepenthes gracilis TaxID=150966 RepID=A0AAD3S0G8_NEPGR|nr:hypothetical protein Nepgr_003897 [Nepenthes gracilis]